MTVVAGAALVAAGFIAGRGLDVFSGPLNSWLMDRKIARYNRQKLDKAA